MLVTASPRSLWTLGQGDCATADVLSGRTLRGCVPRARKFCADGPGTVSTLGPSLCREGPVAEVKE